jgi:hypothetical protein
MSETTAQHRDRMALCETLRSELADAAKNRAGRDGTVSTPYGPEPEWLAYERARMLVIVNLERFRNDLPPATGEAVALVERLAAGHSDYAAKYALYCSELAVGLRGTDGRMVGRG